MFQPPCSLSSGGFFVSCYDYYLTFSGIYGTLAPMESLPGWALQIIDRYESRASGCFIIHGNVDDRIVIPNRQALGTLDDFLLEELLPRFDVVLSYDIGRGVTIERGGDIFQKWGGLRDYDGEMPGPPLDAVRALTHYLAYNRNLRAVGGKAAKVAVIFHQTDLICPALPNALNYDLSALATLMRSWATDSRLQDNGQAVFLLSGQLNALHPQVGKHPRMTTVEIPVPGAKELEQALEILKTTAPTALANFSDLLSIPARRLAGTSLGSVESMLKMKEYRKESINLETLADMKKELVERESRDLIEFVEPDRTLADVYGFESVKDWLRQDIALWKKDEIAALPMGYLFCGPVGTGKTYLAECLAGEAGVPVVTLRNFRDRWVGSTEANLEKIFALLHALGRCIVFIDEADQSLGKRQSGSGDSGVSSRVYSMMAQEMSDTRNRGRILWVLASSRPDLIEVDLKRPGRIDVKIPLFPATDPKEAFMLIRALCKKHKIKIDKDEFENLHDLIPPLTTPGAAEAIAVKTYRLTAAKGYESLEALRECLQDYRPPVDPEIIKFQMQLAADEATEQSFVPEEIQQLLD